jgi:predicted acyl esterase
MHTQYQQPQLHQQPPVLKAASPVSSVCKCPNAEIHPGGMCFSSFVNGVIVD